MKLLLWLIFNIYLPEYHAVDLKKAPSTQKELVEDLKEIKAIETIYVEEAMLKVDRKFYQEEEPYSDFGKHIGYGAEATDPFMVAHMLELLKDNLIYGTNALDIGSGCGYVTACMAALIGKGGHVVGIDHIPELTQHAYNNVMAENPTLLKSGKVVFITAEGRYGYHERAPYDAIHVGGTLYNITEELTDQLKIGGRMVAPVMTKDGRHDAMMVIDKNVQGNISQYFYEYTHMMPLMDKWDQLFKDNKTFFLFRRRGT